MSGPRRDCKAASLPCRKETVASRRVTWSRSNLVHTHAGTCIHARVHTRVHVRSVELEELN